MVAREGASELGEVTTREEVPEGVEEPIESMGRVLAVLGPSWLGEALGNDNVGKRNNGRVREA